MTFTCNTQQGGANKVNPADGSLMTDRTAFSLTFPKRCCKYCVCLHVVPSSSGQDAGLSRRKPGFDSRWDHHPTIEDFSYWLKSFCLFRSPDKSVNKPSELHTPNPISQYPIWTQQPISRFEIPSQRCNGHVSPIGYQRMGRMVFLTSIKSMTSCSQKRRRTSPAVYCLGS